MSEYETMSRQELMRMRSEIDRAIASVGDRDKRAALKAAEAAAREHGFSLSELGPLMNGRARSKTGTPPRYRNPDDASQTWSGRGRRPRWFNEAEAAGRPISDMEITGS